MFKKIIIFTVLFVGIPLFLSIWKVYQYYHYQQVYHIEVRNIKNNIKESNEKIEDLEKECDVLKRVHENDIRTLELWKKRLEKLEKNI